MIPALLTASLIVLALTYALTRRLARQSLPKIRGPRPSSFVLGNLIALFQRSAGQTDFEWQHLYGDVVRFKAVFGASVGPSGEDRLLVADPKALQRMFNTSAYRYPKLPIFRVISRMVNGMGVVWADGEDHKRQRKILLPGFGSSESNTFLDVFRGCAESMCVKWMEIVGNGIDQSAVIDVQGWLSRGTLDATGQAAFDVQFGTIQNDDHPLARVYKNMVHDVLGRPTAGQIFTQAASAYLPTWMLEWMTDHGSNPRLQRAREAKRVATDIAKQLVREKAESLLAGEGNRDIFSLLVKANMDTDAKDKLSEEELSAQMRTILLAGHETTSNSLCWILLELARHPEIQSTLRAEIRETETAIRARGEAQFTIADLEAMHYMTGVIKEGLRYHPVLPHIQRVAGEDDILPLAHPVITESGQELSEIFVPKGTRIVASVAAYNRIKELWGEDAHEFNPDRWLDGAANEKKSVQIGVYGNLMTFIGGTRACLGWRFAVIEIQAFLAELVGRFEFAMTPQAERVDRGAGFLMVPVVEGEFEYGSQLPLIVSVAACEDDV